MSELTIRDARREDSGLFKCIASNRYGRAELKIELIVKEPPDPPNVQLIKVLSRSVVVSWSSPYEGNSPITNYVIQIYKVNGKQEKQTQMKTVTRDNKKIRIEHLKPRAAYKIQVTAENEIGQSRPSDVLDFVTDGEAPQGPPRDVHVLPKGAHSLQISWKPPSPGNNSNNITGYYVGYKEVGKDDPYVFKTLQVTPSYQENCTLNNLKKSTTYSIVVQAFNDKGSGPQTEDVRAQTLLQDFPPTARLRIITSTASSIQLSWKLYGHNMEAIEGYLLFMRQGDSGWKETNLSGSKTSHVISKLRCGTSYEFYLVAYNSVGKADPSQVVTGATTGNVPQAPDQNTALDINDSSVVIRLSAWRARGCPITHFLVKYRTANEGTWRPVSLHLSADRENVVISGLTPGTSYSVLVGVESSAGYTEAQFDFMTKKRNSDLSSTSADTSTQDLQRTVAVITSTVCSVVVLIVILVAACTVLNRRKTSRSEASVAGSTNQRPEIPKSDMVPMAAWDKRTRPSSQREQVYVPSPYASGRFSQFSVDGDTEGCALHGSVGTAGSSGESHSYDVPLHLVHR
ncbi:Down syndrome cell adhesion molecule-like protein Dscam2 isoform X1 [Limulus polyphemus]|uniref:Down syndrome cell adhesion molecule-like protein Dscam2 isoform X1 n=1 Tax=Limulus polyphemus TaxID=6850 RepID=A0ABM1TGK4_LIMPO|nr:Down syndrome cell adhesion molecule-like protein Dscam2 isoform X1 [Limulus polyphemus]